MTNELQLAILQAVRDLSPNAYGVPVHRAVEAALGKTISYGALYIAIDALEAEHMLSSKHADATPERGGREKRYLFLEIPGERALAKTGTEPTSV